MARLQTLCGVDPVGLHFTAAYGARRAVEEINTVIRSVVTHSPSFAGFCPGVRSMRHSTGSLARCAHCAAELRATVRTARKRLGLLVCEPAHSEQPQEHDMSTLPQPIRVDLDMWICMRNDAAQPKASIQRVHTPEGDRFLLFQWDLDPAKRVLRGMHESLEKANALVRFDTPQNGAQNATPSSAPSAPFNAAPLAPPTPPQRPSLTESELEALAAMRGAGAMIKR